MKDVLPTRPRYLAEAKGMLDTTDATSATVDAINDKLAENRQRLAADGRAT